MILYNITINVDSDIHEEWLDWIRNKHIPDVLSTGLFIENKICKIHAEEEGGLSYSIQYLLKNWENYNSYLDQYAMKLQKEHLDRYLNKFAAFRTVLEVIHHSVVS